MIRSEVVAWCLESCSAPSVTLAALWGQQRRRQLQPRLAEFYSALLQQLGLGAAEAGAGPEAAGLGAGFGLGTGHACSGAQTEQVGGLSMWSAPWPPLFVAACSWALVLLWGLRQHWWHCGLAVVNSPVMCEAEGWSLCQCIRVLMGVDKAERIANNLICDCIA